MREQILYGALALLALSAAGCTATATVSAGCNEDTSVSCTNGAAGWSCPTGSLAPDYSVASLTCSVPTSVGGMDEYCCADITVASGSTCAQDQSVSGCAGDSYGFSCTGTDRPDTDYSGIVCSSAGVLGQNIQGANATLYCCSYGSTSTSTGCSQDSTVSCAGGATGYSCPTGSSPPNVDVTSLLCSTPTPAGTTDQYCCTAASAAVGSTCAQDQSVTGCVGSFGFACTGADTPESDFTGVTCGASGTAGTNAQGSPATLFCCTLGNAACAVGADTGTQACDDCVATNCCSDLTACAGADDGGTSGCDQFIACVLACVVGNADAGVAGESMSSCEDECNPSNTYSASDVQSAVNVFNCMTSNCSSQCSQ